MRALPVLGLVLVLGCVGVDEPPGSRIAQAVFAKELGPACGGRPADTVPAEMFVVTAEHCLDCKEVGWMLRERSRQLAGTGVVAWVGVVHSDTSDVCPYLRNERVLLPVVLLPEDSFGGAVRSKQLLRLLFHGSAPPALLWAVDARSMLEAIAIAKKGGSTPGVQP